MHPSAKELVQQGASKPHGKMEEAKIFIIFKTIFSSIIPISIPLQKPTITHVAVCCFHAGVAIFMDLIGFKNLHSKDDLVSIILADRVLKTGTMSVFSTSSPIVLIPY